MCNKDLKLEYVRPSFCGHSEEQIKPFQPFQASTNPDSSSIGVFLECELQAHPPYLVFNF